MNNILVVFLLVFLIIGAYVGSVYPDQPAIKAVLAAICMFLVGALIYRNRNAYRGRTAAHGVNSIFTVLVVLSILGVLNFLSSRYPQKLDLTKNKRHTLSPQTTQVIKGLKEPVRAVYFSKADQREALRPLMDNLKGLNPNFEVEYVDPDKEPSRAKTAGIKAYGTLQLISGTRDSKIDAANEEKITNTLIKMLKSSEMVICAITGHGEKDFDSNQADGYEAVKKALEEQSYKVTPVNLVTDGKIPETCQAITLLGPTKAFFDAETKLIKDYLEQGGRALIATDLNIKGQEYSPELALILKTWNVRPLDALIIDPVSKMLQLEPTVPIIATYSRENPITRDFQGNAIFPLTRPLEIMANSTELKTEWIAQTTAQSWGETDFKSLGQGRVQMESADRRGPLNAAIAIDGKQKNSQAKRNTRIVVFGTSSFASNQFSRFGNNLDFFLNAIGWLTEDESMITIRTKDDEGGKIELSQQQGTLIFLLTVIVIPLGTAVAGIFIWMRRKKL